MEYVNIENGQFKIIETNDYYIFDNVILEANSLKEAEKKLCERMVYLLSDGEYNIEKLNDRVNSVETSIEILNERD